MVDSALPHVLISNDDGYDAPGLAALYGALSGLAEVSVVAPAKGVSSAGHGVTDRRPIYVERSDVEPYGPIHIVHALPADCVRLALTERLDHRPDWVISGINRGGNLGVDVYYSGTVAAAREAAFLGVPAVAISQYFRVSAEAPPEWSRAAEWTRIVLERIFAAPSDKQPPVWNVNLPHLGPTEQPHGMTIAPLAQTPLRIRYQRVEHTADLANEAKRSGDTYQFSGQYSERPAPAGSDVDVTFKGHITLTPLALDLTYQGDDDAFADVVA
jgi:5'-nucleotidase